MDLGKASRKLSELDLNITVDNLAIKVLWFRAMITAGEWNIGRHTHSSFEFHFIKSGYCRVIHDGGEFVVGEGEFYLTAPSVFHEQRNKGLEQFVEYSISCDLKLIDDRHSEGKLIFDILSQTPCKVFNDCTGITELFDKSLEEAYNRDFGFYNNIRCFVYMIISRSAAAVNTDTLFKYDVPVKKHKDDHRLVQIERFIEDNVSNPISTSDIARFLYLSDKQVCRLVKESKGITTKELISRVKLQKAKELLKDTGMPIKEISSKLGFSSEYYFNQFFKREEGYPPGIYRYNVQNV